MNRRLDPVVEDRARRHSVPDPSDVGEVAVGDTGHMQSSRLMARGRALRPSRAIACLPSLATHLLASCPFH